MKMTGPKSIPNKSCGALRALLCWTAVCRCFPGLLIWWCSLHIWPPFWCYSAFHKLPALYTHQPQGSQSNQSPLSSLCTCQLPLNFNSFLSTGHLAFIPIALKLLFYNLFYQIVAKERSTEKETLFPLALWYLSFASDFSFIRKRMNF